MSSAKNYQSVLQLQGHRRISTNPSSITSGHSAKSPTDNLGSEKAQCNDNAINACAYQERKDSHGKKGYGTQSGGYGQTISPIETYRRQPIHVPMYSVGQNGSLWSQFIEMNPNWEQYRHFNRFARPRRTYNNCGGRSR